MLVESITFENRREIDEHPPFQTSTQCLPRLEEYWESEAPAEPAKNRENDVLSHFFPSRFYPFHQNWDCTDNDDPNGDKNEVVFDNREIGEKVT